MSDGAKSKIVGITGGIGSGKSTVGNLLTERGFIVIDTDAVARELTSAGSPILEKIVKVFGADSLDSHGNLNRAWMASEVFSNGDKLRTLERILHPPIMELCLKRALESRHPFVFLLVPLLFEANFQDSVDYIWLCFAPKEVRMKRAMNRDNADEALITQRMRWQLPDEEKIDRVDYVIYTDGSIEEVERQVEEALGSLNRE